MFLPGVVNFTGLFYIRVENVTGDKAELYPEIANGRKSLLEAGQNMTLQVGGTSRRTTLEFCPSSQFHHQPMYQLCCSLSCCNIDGLDIYST